MRPESQHLYMWDSNILYDFIHDESINIVMLCGLLNSISPLAEFLDYLLTTISYSSNVSPIISRSSVLCM